MEEAHSLLTEKVALLIEKSKTISKSNSYLISYWYFWKKKDYIPFVVGGGNDQSYPNASGLLRVIQNKRLGSEEHFTAFTASQLLIFYFQQKCWCDQH